ncbi:hypothetical protein F5Y16DRAFT_394816 [Xylariaceae sp. FL0255]|nr:hypothetical protein F5Y16DRAFT_394816 [Xylariaceae sp. FL0255]
MSGKPNASGPAGGSSQPRFTQEQIRRNAEAHRRAQMQVEEAHRQAQQAQQTQQGQQVQQAQQAQQAQNDKQQESAKGFSEDDDKVFIPNIKQHALDAVSSIEEYHSSKDTTSTLTRGQIGSFKKDLLGFVTVKDAVYEFLKREGPDDSFGILFNNADAGSSKQPPLSA